MGTGLSCGGRDMSEGSTNENQSEKNEYIVGSAEELTDGERLLVELEGLEIGVFNLDGEYVAYLNWCPHQGGPLCEGGIGGTTEVSFTRKTLEVNLEWVGEGEILRCPWHSWEFDLRDNEFLHDAAVTLPRYPVYERNGKIVLEI